MNKIRVLIVDDEDDFRETLVNRLQNRGFVVDGVPTGEKALEWLAHQDCDIVVLDMLMPGMHGVECLKQIKKVKPRVEVILLTGHGTVQLGIMSLKMGAFDYVMKPAPLDELIEKIELAFEKKGA
jgi:DNA-binding NtrC family response regulator